MKKEITDLKIAIGIKIFILMLEILIAIVLIILFVNARDIFDINEYHINHGCTQMELNEHDKYNVSLRQFRGKNVRGSNVKLLIDEIISKNSNNINTIDRFIGIEIIDVEIPEYTSLDIDNLNNACMQASSFSHIGDRIKDEGKIYNNSENVRKATEEMEKLKNKIEPKKGYSVYFSYGEGYIVWVQISAPDLNFPWLR